MQLLLTRHNPGMGRSGPGPWPGQALASTRANPGPARPCPGSAEPGAGPTWPRAAATLHGPAQAGCDPGLALSRAGLSLAWLGLAAPTQPSQALARPGPNTALALVRPGLPKTQPAAASESSRLAWLPHQPAGRPSPPGRSCRSFPAGATLSTLPSRPSLAGGHTPDSACWAGEKSQLALPAGPADACPWHGAVRWTASLERSLQVALSTTHVKIILQILIVQSTGKALKKHSHPQ